MFKKIVSAIAAIHTQEDFNAVCGIIDTAYQQEKITWKDHETLYSLIIKIHVEHNHHEGGN